MIQSAKTRLGSSDHELPVAKFRLKLKKVGKTTRPFRYDLHQIPYDYKVEVTNRFKGLAPIDRVPEELWREVHYIVQEAVIKIILKKKKCKRAKWLYEEALKQLRKEEKQKAKEPRKDIPIKMQSSKEYQGEIRKPSSVINRKKKWRKTIEWEKPEISSRKLEKPREYVMQNGHNKGQKWYEPNRSRRY